MKSLHVNITWNKKFITIINNIIKSCISLNKKFSPINKIIYLINIIKYKCVKINIKFLNIIFYLIKGFINEVILKLNII